MVHAHIQPFPSLGLLKALDLPIERALVAQQQGMQGLSAQWRREVQIGCGLQNLGNSCYLNSVLQCLAHLPPLANSCLAKLHGRSCRLQKENRLCICCTFERQVNSMLTASSASSGYRMAVAPSAIYNSVHALNKNLQRGRQEDSHELLRSLVDAMERNLLRQAGNYNPQRPPKHPRTVVNQLFGGILQNQVHCLQCGHASRTCDPCMDLSLELGTGCSSVEEALRRFTAVEKLDGDNKYRCEGCKQLVPAHKQMTIYDDPNVLVIHLKRFDGIFGAKISREIAFSETLDLEPYICPSRRVRCGASSSSNSNGQLNGCSSNNGYTSCNGHSSTSTCLNNRDHSHCSSNGSSSSSQQQQINRTSPGHYMLHGVLVHHGYSANSGHYLAYVKDGVAPNGHWHCMNDAQVYRVNVPAVLKQQAYILFYVRTSMKQQALLPKHTEQDSTAAAVLGSPGRLKRSTSAAADGQQQQQQRMIGPQLPPHLQVKRRKVQDDNSTGPAGQHQQTQQQQQQQQQQPVVQPEQQRLQQRQQSGPVFGPQLPPWYSSRRKSSDDQQPDAAPVGQLSGVAAVGDAGDSGQAAAGGVGGGGGGSGQFFAWAKPQQQQQQDCAKATPSSSLPPPQTQQQQQQRLSKQGQLPSLCELREGFDERLKPVNGEVRSWLSTELTACKDRGMTPEQCKALYIPQLEKNKLIRETIQQYYKSLLKRLIGSGVCPLSS